MKSISKNNIIYIALLMLLMSIGFAIRIAPIIDLQATYEKNSKNQPLLATGDGYYYLSIARDIVDGTYEQIDDKRAVPENPTRPTIPPLLSLITAIVSIVTNYSLNWIAVILPALLGVLVALPLSGIGHMIGGAPMALTAVGVALFSNSYIARSTFGKFDTDCLIVTLTLSTVYFFMRFAFEKSYRRYYFFSAGILCWLFFVNWWDQVPHIATLISFWPLIIALLFHFRPHLKEAGVFYVLTGSVCVFVLFWFGFDLPMRFINTIQDHFYYLIKTPQNNFPSVGVMITEQQNYDLATIITITTNSSITFFSAMAGLFLLYYQQFHKAFFLFVPILLAGLSFFYASRFLIFLGPIAGLGLGFITTRIWHRYHGNKLIYVLPIFIIYAFWRCLDLPVPAGLSPFPVASINAMQTMKNVTPENAVIWSWWDNGYPINYWADRATICDGQLHNGEILVYNSLPLATENPRLSANFMNFFIHRSQSGMQTLYKAVKGNQALAFQIMKQIMAAGPNETLELIKKNRLPPLENLLSNQDWLEFFFPPSKHPIYIFIDYPQIQTSHWITWLGSWDIEKKDGIHAIEMKARKGISIDGIKINTIKDQLTGDLQSGIAMYQNSTIPLSSAALTTNGKTVFYNFGKKPVKAPDILAAGLQHSMNIQNQLFITRSYHLEVSEHADTVLLMGQDVAETIIHKLFWRGKALQSEHLTPIVDHSPEYQIWKVNPDQLEQ